MKFTFTRQWEYSLVLLGVLVVCYLLGKFRITPIVYRESLPNWINDGPSALSREFITGSGGLTDKSTSHKYQYLYYRYLSNFIKNKHAKNDQFKIVMLEIGLGCAPGGGMVHGTPGGSSLAWLHLFNIPGIDLELHVLEFDRKCGEKWAANHPKVNVHIGDQGNKDDLQKIVQASSKQGFDIIIDDGSHMNHHQIFSFTYLIPYLIPGGFYVIEDIHSSCINWSANLGTHNGPGTGGTADCMGTKEKPTIYKRLFEWQKLLLVGQSPFDKIDHIDINLEAAVIEKNLI